MTIEKQEPIAGPEQQLKPTRNRQLGVFSAACILFAILAVYSSVRNRETTSGDDSSRSSAGATANRSVIPIRYVVDGRPEHASITYQNADGGTSQVSKAKVPWTLDFQAKPGAFLYLSAQEGSGNDKSSITATIYVDGFKFKSSTSAGAYVIASASGSVPRR